MKLYIVPIGVLLLGESMGCGAPAHDDTAAAGSELDAPPTIANGGYSFSGCEAALGWRSRDGEGFQSSSWSFTRSSTDGYYSWQAQSKNVSVRGRDATGRLLVAIGSATGALSFSPWDSQYAGTLISPTDGASVGVTVTVGGSASVGQGNMRLRLVTETAPIHRSYPDGSWGETSVELEFQSDRRCGTGRE
jgi:hypothetical protein